MFGLSDWRGPRRRQRHVSVEGECVCVSANASNYSRAIVCVASVTRMKL